MVKTKTSGVVINEISHVVHVDDVPYYMPPTEYRLLGYLMRNKNTLIDRKTLSKHLKINGSDASRAVDSYIARLRKHGIDRIKTITGYGYRFDATAEDKIID